MENRVVWIDYAKAVTIFLVVLAHTPLITSAQNFIYVFHMPVFFFLSGYLFSFERHPQYVEFLKRRAFQLLIPYLFFSLSTYIFWLFIGRKFGDDAGADIPFYQPLLGIVYGNGIAPWMIHCIPLWFLPCLFLVENLYYVSFKHIKNKLPYVIITAIIAYVFIQFNTIRFPWGFNTAVVALAIYGLGNISKAWIKKIQNLKIVLRVGLMSLTFVLVYFISQQNGRINMHIHYYGNYFLFLIGGLSGIIGIVLLCDLFQYYFKRNFWIEYFGKNTLTILGFHLIAGSLIKGATLYIFKLPLEIYKDAFWLNLGFSFTSFLVLTPVIYLLNSYFPFLIGKKKERYAIKPAQ